MRLPFGLWISRRRLGRWLDGRLNPAALLRVRPAVREELLWHVRGAIDEGGLDDAERICDLVLANWPGDAEALVCVGAVHQLRGDFQRAIERYGQVLAVDPGHPHALVNRAECHLKLGAHSAARADLAALALALSTPKTRAAWRNSVDLQRRSAAIREGLAIADADGSGS